MGNTQPVILNNPGPVKAGASFLSDNTEGSGGACPVSDLNSTYKPISACRDKMEQK